MIDKGILVECVTQSTTLVPRQIRDPISDIRTILSRNYPELKYKPIPLNMALDIFKKIIVVSDQNSPVGLLDKALVYDLLNQFDVYFVESSFSINIYCDDDNDRSYLLSLLNMSGFLVWMYKSSPVFKTHLQLYNL